MIRVREYIFQVLEEVGGVLVWVNSVFLQMRGNVLPGIALSATGYVGNSYYGVGEVVSVSNKLLLNGQ
jgi:hypothetical protein